MKYVFNFNEANVIERGSMKDILGGKGYGLVEMCNLGLPVPEGFIITTFACRYFMNHGKFPRGLKPQIMKAIADLEAVTGKKFGVDLQVSVRSGAKISMPGMMDTILNVGSVDGDNRDRFNKMYKETVGLNPIKNLERMLMNCITAVFNSWNSSRAIEYRELYNIPHDIGTAVVIQRMVFGNSGHKSGTGVCFTRNPNDGGNSLYGEFLNNAQGEDIVSGTHTPHDIYSMSETYLNQLIKYKHILENHFKDMQDIEFTIEYDKLYLLQTRNGKRSSNASVKIAHDLHIEGIISKQQAVKMVNFDAVLSQQKIDYNTANVLGNGLAASQGVATGRAVFSADKCDSDTILIRDTTDPNDFEGMVKAKGFLTMRGGKTSHAAVVARGLNKPCVVAFNGAIVNNTVIRFKHIITEGDIITIDGNTGSVIKGTPEMKLMHDTEYLQQLFTWRIENV